MNSLLLATLLALPALAPALVPAHGTLLSVSGNTAVIATEAVPGEFPAATRAYTLSKSFSATVPTGTGLDGIVDRSHKPWQWTHPTINGPFVPGMPDRALATPVDIGTRLFTDPIVNQNGQVLSLRSFQGKVTLVSFIFTRCPDATLCPAISGKFAYLQHHLDPKYFHLVEITLDPQYDSPAVLRQYGKRYGADASIWTLATAEPYTIQRYLDSFGINSLRVSSTNFIHNDKLFIYDLHGKVTDVVETAGWSPVDVASEAHHIAGMDNNIFGRMRLSLIASVVALCGGSQYVGVVLMDIFILLASMAGAGVALFFIARHLWTSEP